MSKIQEALKKMQGAKVVSGSKGQPVEEAASESAILARLVIRHSERDVSSAEHEPNHEKVVQFDQQALRDAGLIAPEYHERLLSDQYREIKRPLIANAYGKRTARVEDGNLIMVSSALAGEGKTFTTINLALSMAREKDHSVLLIDADVAKPHISSIFGVEESKGLLDLLEDRDLDIGAVILPTDIPGLSIMPAGKPRENATELLASSRMEKLIATLRDRNKKSLVLLDSPPLLQTTESKVLAGLVGQVVLVVRAEETPQGAVMAAVEAIDKGRPVNLILNQARTGSNESQYGYGYQHGSAYGSSENIEKSASSNGELWS